MKENTSDDIVNQLECFEEYRSSIPERNEAIYVCIGNIMKNEELDRESARIVVGGLLDILFSANTKHRKWAIDSFGIVLPKKNQGRNALVPKRPVGRPSLTHELRAVKEDYKDSVENVLYYDVLISFKKLKEKRSPNAPKVSWSDAFRRVAKERNNNESPKTISVKFYRAQKRLELL